MPKIGKKVTILIKNLQKKFLLIILYIGESNILHIIPVLVRVVSNDRR